MRTLVGGVIVALGLLWAPPALAAFPGANGLLAVQPASGGGILIVGANGRGAHRICTLRERCGTPRRPRWSPDGRSLVFAGPAIRIVYTDGSCLDCEFGAASNPAFEAGGTVISFIQRGRVTVDGIDTLRKQAPRVSGVSDAVWSRSGELAVVRHGAVWAGRPGKLHLIAVAGEPSWAPRGDRLAAVQRGWVVIVDLLTHHVRRLARGSAPAFSPDGRWIAFVGPGHRLMAVPARGGRPRTVGHIRAVSVDWQPRPRGVVHGCAAPPDSTVVARDSDAIVTQDGAPGLPRAFEKLPSVAYMGCLRKTGRERLLERYIDNNYDNASWITSARLAAPYTALVEHSEDEHYGGSGDIVRVFDLGTGAPRPDLGGEAAVCPTLTGDTCAVLDQLVLDRDGVSAAHWQAVTHSAVPTGLETVACAPGTTLCVALDQALSDIVTSTDPRAGSGSWVTGRLFAAAAPAMVTCPSASLCVGALAAVYTSSQPAVGAPTWTVTPLRGQAVTASGISCPTASLCVITRDDGSIATSGDPAGGTRAWTTARIGPAHGISAIVCSAAPRCFVTNPFGPGTVFTSANPTGGAGAWRVSATTPTFQSGSCPTTNLCVTVNGQEIATTTDPGAGTWTRHRSGDLLNSVSCPSASLCVAAGAGAVDVSTDPASGTWTHVPLNLTLTSVSCPSTSLCVATDLDGDVVVSTDPAGGAAAWVPSQLKIEPCQGATPCSVERIEASDKEGLHFYDMSEFGGAGPFLTGLTLNDDTLSWSHAGSPRAVQLTRP